MADQSLIYFATDKEIYDVLMSSKQKIGETVLLDLAKDRGIFYSSYDSRETLANNLSLLPHDFNDLNSILTQREHTGRSEKVTSMQLNATLKIDEIKEIAQEFQKDAPSDEKVVIYPEGPNKYIVKVKYSELDYSKNRLLQRKKKEAGIEFIIENDKTTIRMPANAKAAEIVQDIKTRLDGRNKTEIPMDRIELSEFGDPETRTMFFTKLITSLPDFKLVNVTSVKVESSIADGTREDIDLEDDQETEQAKQEMLAVVKNVALKGQSLLASNEYKELKKRGFYITYIIWCARVLKADHRMVEFEAGFDEPESGKGFKYNVRGAKHLQKGEYTKYIKPIPQVEKEVLLSLLEQTARKTLSNLRGATNNTGKESVADTGGDDK